MATKKYLSLERLKEYDGLIKGVIEAGDDSTLESAKSYAEELATGKSDTNHTHDDRYYTESEIDSKLSGINSSITNITSGTTVVKKAEHATTADSATTAESATTATTAEKLGSTDVGNSTKPVYLKGGVATPGSTYAGGTKVTINGSDKGGSDAAFYAPTEAGTSGHILTSTGTGAPTWTEVLPIANGGTGAKTAEDARANLGVYSTTEVDTALAGKSDTSHKHDNDYDVKGAADTALETAKSYTDTKTNGMATTTVVDNKISAHNTSTAAHSDIRDLISELSTKVNNFLDVDDTTTDQLSEVLTLINNNKGTLESLTSTKVNVSDIVDNLTTSNASKVLSAKQGVALKALIDALQAEVDGKAEEGHGHAISDVSGLQAALDGKAASSHGTHVTYSTTAPVMDGTASAGTADSVARSDHKHPTDTSRASQADLTALSNTVSGKADKTHSHAISEVTNLQSALDGKQATITGAATTIASSDLTANRALISNASGKVAVSDVTSTELSYLDGVTSAIQTQLDGKALASDLTTHTGNADIHFTAAERTKLAGIDTGANKITVDTALSSTSTNPVQNKVVNSAVATLTSSVTTNTNSISAHTTAIANLQEAIDEIQDITSEEIQNLFK